MTKFQVETGVVEVDGAPFSYETAGSGPSLVLVHAGIADKTMWDEQFAAFAENYRVIRYDMRGYGHSATPLKPFSHHHDLYMLLEALEVESAHLVGCSQGAATVIDFALVNPARTTSLVLVSPAVNGYEFTGEPPQAILELMAALGEQDLDKAAELAVQLWAVGPKRTADEVNVMVRDCVSEMSRFALTNQLSGVVSATPLKPPATGRLSAIDRPSFIVGGESDDDSILLIADLLTQKMQGAEQIIIPKTAHMLNMEKPKAFNEKVLDFLARV